MKYNPTFLQCIYHITTVILSSLIIKGYITLLESRSNLETMTVQAPQPPSAQPSFVPVNPTELLHN